MINHLNFVWWVGVVENRQDPLKLGRCQVRIFGFHTENKQTLPTENLPWSHPVLPINNSNPYAPKEGDSVVGFFMDGEEGQFPVMMGILPGIPVRQENSSFGFNDPRNQTQLNNAPVKIGESKERYPRVIDEPTTPRVARGENLKESQYYQKIEGSKSSASYVEPMKKFASVYPYNNVYESESGHLFEMDDTPSQERINLFHRIGSYKEMHADGDVFEKAKKDKYETIEGNETVYVGKNLNLIVDGDTTFTIKGNFNVQCENFSLNSSDSSTLSSNKTSIFSQLLSSFSSFGATTVSSMGYTSLSSLAYTSVGSLGYLNLSSSSIAKLGAPKVLIGKFGGAIPKETKAAMEQASKNSALTTLQTGAGGSITGAASSLSGGGFSLIQTGTTSLAASDAILGQIQSSISILDLPVNFAGQAATTLGGVGGYFDSALNLIKSGTASLSTIAQLAGTTAAIVAEPLNAILNLDKYTALNNFLSNLGPVSELANAVKDSSIFSAAKNAFNAIKDTVWEPIKNTGIVESFEKLAEVGNTVYSPGFLQRMDQHIDDAIAYAEKSGIAPTGFSDLKNSLNSATISNEEISSAITPLYDNFIDSASNQFTLDMPNVDGVSTVMSRVSTRMKGDTQIKDTVVSIVSEGKKTGLSQSEIEKNVNAYLSDSFSNIVSEEMNASPITYLNILEA